MTGRVLGFDITKKQGIILGDNGQRYSFDKDQWKEQMSPTKDLKVDFEITEDNKAIIIYTIKDHSLENTNIIFGLITIGITFIFGFIGTLVSRIVLAKQSFSEALIPTLIHFVLTMILFVPIVGWIVYLVGTVYYMYKNYILTVNR